MTGTAGTGGRRAARATGALRPRVAAGSLLVAAVLALAALAVAGPASALDCTAPPVTCLQRVTGLTRGAPSVEITYGCSITDFTGPELAHEFTNPVLQPVSFVLDDSVEPLLDLFVLDACDPTRCLGAGDDSVTLLLDAGTYYVVVDGRAGAAGPYALEVACGRVLEPRAATFTANPGDCVSEHKTAWLTPTAPQVDVVFVIDVSGSMGPLLAAVQASLTDMVDQAAAFGDDVAFGIISLSDYYSEEIGMAPCWFSGPNYGRDFDYPYRLDLPVTTSRGAVATALGRLSLLDGLDPPEAYARALYEAGADPAVGWRPGARRVVVTFLDDLPHDCNVFECMGRTARSPLGVDFGRDGLGGTADDLRIVDVVDGLAAQDITLIVFDAGGQIVQDDATGWVTSTDLWECWARRTGGAAKSITRNGTGPDGESLVDMFVQQVQQAVAPCDVLEIRADPGYESWLAQVMVDPGPHALPTVLELDLELCVPAGLPAGSYTFGVALLCDGVELARQSVTLDVGGCTPPSPITATARDLSPCSAGLEVAWDAAVFPSGGGAYNLFRSEVGCADALSRPPVAVGLRTTSWIDRDAGGRSMAYVVEAEDALAGSGCAVAGVGHGGAASRACIEPPVVDVGTDAWPEGVGDVLRAKHAGDEVTFTWTAARPLLAGEHFHLLKASTRADGAFARVTPEGMRDVLHVETDVTSPLQFFDLRVANACEDQSLDEFPPGWDNGRTGALQR